MTASLKPLLTYPMPQQIFNIRSRLFKSAAATLAVAFLSSALLGCSLLEKQPDSVDKIIQRASNQKIFFANYDLVWKAAHAAIKYTIASENQDFGVIETDYVKSVDGWLPPEKTKP
jgi:hypothetical protein